MKGWLLSLHLVAVVSWMAGILYLYRLVVYHVEETEPVVRTRFRVMERRLYRAITVPAMIVSILAGTAMILLEPGYYLRAHWLHAKLALVALLVVVTLYAGGTVRRLAAGGKVRTALHFRAMNEVPTLILIGIVLLVILRPF